MDVALKKIELIEWLSRLQDEKLIQQIEALKKGSSQERHDARIPKTKSDLQDKLGRSEKDIQLGRIHSQAEVERFFQAKFVNEEG